MRISVNGTRIDSNTGKYIDPALWNQSKERAKGTLEKARAFDPFGHAGLTPLGEIRMTLAGAIKMTPVEASAGEY